MNKSLYWVAAVVLVALIGTAGYLWRQQQPTAVPVAPPPRAVAAPPVVQPAASSASEPSIKHPIEASVDNPPAATPQDVEGALAELFGRKTVLSMFQTQDFARRFVATVENLGRSRAPVTVWPVNPTAGA